MNGAEIRPKQNGFPSRESRLHAESSENYLDRVTSLPLVMAGAGSGAIT